jgi:hypothetical protein
MLRVRPRQVDGPYRRAGEQREQGQPGSDKRPVRSAIGPQVEPADRHEQQAKCRELDQLGRHGDLVRRVEAEGDESQVTEDGRRDQRE